MKIIIRTPNFIGDTIMMLPALELIKKEYSNSEITIVCKASSVDLFRDKNIKNIIIDDTKNGKKGRLKRTFKLINTIKKEHYELGFIFHNTLLDAIIFKLSNIDKLIGYDKEQRKIFLDFYLKIDRTRHYVNHYANLVNKFLDDKYSDLPKMELSFYESKFIENSKNKTVGFALGGDNKDTRRYPKELSVKLFELFKGEDINIVLLGDKDDSLNNKIYEDVLENNNNNILNLSGKTNVSEFIDAIGSLDLLVTIDSSAVHIAAAVNTKFILLVGKGSSALDTTYPKVDFGTKIYKGQNKIKDEDMIYAISPDDIFQLVK